MQKYGCCYYKARVNAGLCYFNSMLKNTSAVLIAKLSEIREKQMEYRELGNTGIMVSRLCFGGLVIGPLQKKISTDEGQRLLQRP